MRAVRKSSHVIWKWDERCSMTKTGTAMGNWWLAASSRQRARLCIMSRAEFFAETYSSGDYVKIMYSYIEAAEAENTTSVTLQYVCSKRNCAYTPCIHTETQRTCRIHVKIVFLWLDIYRQFISHFDWFTHPKFCKFCNILYYTVNVILMTGFYDSISVFCITEIIGPYLLYSPNLAPCDFWLFPKLKSPLKETEAQLSYVQFCTFC